MMQNNNNGNGEKEIINIHNSKELRVKSEFVSQNNEILYRLKLLIESGAVDPITAYRYLAIEFYNLSKENDGELGSMIDPAQ